MKTSCAHIPTGFTLRATPLFLLCLGSGGANAEDHASLPEIIVTATRSAKPVEETPVASYVVSAREMERRNIKSIDDAVNLIPGVFQRRGKGYMDTLNAISLRGVPEAKRSLIMVDGLPINVYFMRMSHAYGQGLWGGRVIQDGQVTRTVAPQLGVDLLKLALKGVEGAVHSRSSNIYAALDNDDFYQYLGGTAMAIRQVNGATPEVLVTNMANPKEAKTETLEKYMGRELRSRYLNPKWIDAMLGEGYAGARFVNNVVENLWGWTVATPDKIDDAKWQEMYETYIADRHRLGIRQKFRDAKNLLAYQAMADRMLTAVNKGYWKASAETVDALKKPIWRRLPKRECHAIRTPVPARRSAL